MFRQLSAEGKNPVEAKVQSGQKWYMQRVSTCPRMTLNPSPPIFNSRQASNIPSSLHFPNYDAITQHKCVSWEEPTKKFKLHNTEMTTN